MAVTAAVVGGGLVAAGTAAAIRAQQMKTKARANQYGGSTDARDGYRTAYSAGADQGNDAYGAGVRRLNEASANATDQVAQGQQIATLANGIQSPTLNTVGSGLLAAYQPGQVAAAQTQQVLDRNAANTLGTARQSGPLGVRNAIMANANAGVQAAQGLATERAQEEQALLGAKVAQNNQEQAAYVDQNNAAQAQRVQLLGLGSQIQAGANGQVLSTGQSIGQLGLGNQGQYLNQLGDVNSQQLTADMDYERRRQADQQRKSQNLFGLGQSLIGGGAKAIGGGGK